MISVKLTDGQMNLEKEKIDDRNCYEFTCSTQTKYTNDKL